MYTPQLQPTGSVHSQIDVRIICVFNPNRRLGRMLRTPCPANSGPFRRPRKSALRDDHLSARKHGLRCLRQIFFFNALKHESRNDTLQMHCKRPLTAYVVFEWRPKYCGEGEPLKPCKTWILRDGNVYHRGIVRDDVGLSLTSVVNQFILNFIGEANITRRWATNWRRTFCFHF